MDVGAWMEFETEHAAAVAGIVEERPPAAGEFLEGFIDQTRRPLRPGVDQVPGNPPERTGTLRKPSFADASMYLRTSLAAHSVRAVPRRPDG